MRSKWSFVRRAAVGKWLLLIPATLGAISLCGCLRGSERERPVVKFCVLPPYPSGTGAQGFLPLAKYLSEATGYDVRYVNTLNSETYARTVEWSKVDFGFHDALLQVALSKSRGARPLLMAVGPDGEPRCRGVVIAGGGVSSLADLRGKRIAVATKATLSGYLGQQALCQQAGIDIDRECSVILVQDYEAVAARVAEGRADAGFLPELQEWEVGWKPCVIAHTEYMPGWCVAAFPGANDVAVEAVKRALLDLEFPEHGDLLGPMNAWGFVETEDPDFAPARTLALELHIPL